MRRAWLLVLAIAIGGTAGCLGFDGDPADGEIEAAEAWDEDGEEAPLALEGEDCLLGGGQSVHPREMAGVQNFSELVPDPWRVADVLEDTGEQFTYSQWPKPTAPKPEEGDTWGHWHASLVCETWRLDGEERDLSFGFVGPKVQSPDFVEAGADDAYLATVIATNDDALREELQRGGVDVMDAEVDVRQEADGVAIGMSTDHNGDYLSAYGLNELGPIEDEHVRLWSQQERPDGTYTPIALELTREGGTHYGDLGEGYFHHERTAHHWPLPGAYGHTAAAHYEGFDVSLSWGPTPNVTLEEAYHH